MLPAKPSIVSNIVFKYIPPLAFSFQICNFFLIILWYWLKHLGEGDHYSDKRYVTLQKYLKCIHRLCAFKPNQWTSNAYFKYDVTYLARCRDCKPSGVRLVCTLTLRSRHVTGRTPSRTASWRTRRGKSSLCCTLMSLFVRWVLRPRKSYQWSK